MYDSAYKTGIKSNHGVRVPKIPKQKEKFEDAPKFSGVELMPKTAEQQKTENNIKGVAIKVMKPKLTIKGFVVDKPKEIVKNQSSMKSMKKADSSI